VDDDDPKSDQATNETDLLVHTVSFWHYEITMSLSMNYFFGDFNNLKQ